VDTKEMVANVDTLPRSPKKSSSGLHRVGTTPALLDQDPRRLWWVVGLVATALLLGLIVALWVAFSGDSSPRATSKKDMPPRSRSNLIVNRSGQDGAFKTVREALSQAKRGTRIVVQDDTVEEQLELNDTRQITLEAQPGKTVVWRCPDKLADSKRLVSLGNTVAVRFQGFVFDGRDRVEDIFLVFGNCPDLVLDHVELRGFKTCAVHVVNCAGTAEHPIILADLKTTTAKEVPAAMMFELQPHYTNPTLNQHFVIRNCRFEGPYRQVVQRSKPDVLKDAHWTDNLVQPTASKPATPLPVPK
jgi:hypothetical protein